MDADGLVVPGVGAFAACMAGCGRCTGREIIGRRLAGGRPVLGICVGMQVLFEHGVEHGVDDRGLRRVARARSSGCRRPSCRTWAGTPSTCPPGAGCSRASRTSGSTSCTPTASATGRCVTNGRTRAPLVTWAEHGGDRFVAAVENGPLCATQFHPEKSGDAGAALLRNWVATL